MMTTWEVYIRIPKNGHSVQIKTQVVAENVHRAIMLFEAQYGKDTVIGIPREVK
jgi:hypothetical protein